MVLCSGSTDNVDVNSNSAPVTVQSTCVRHVCS